MNLFDDQHIPWEDDEMSYDGEPYQDPSWWWLLVVLGAITALLVYLL